MNPVAKVTKLTKLVLEANNRIRATNYVLEKVNDVLNSEAASDKEVVTKWLLQNAVDCIRTDSEIISDLIEEMSAELILMYCNVSESFTLDPEPSSIPRVGNTGDAVTNPEELVFDDLLQGWGVPPGTKVDLSQDGSTEE